MESFTQAPIYPAISGIDIPELVVMSGEVNLPILMAKVLQEEKNDPVPFMVTRGLHEPGSPGPACKAQVHRHCSFCHSAEHEGPGHWRGSLWRLCKHQHWTPGCAGIQLPGIRDPCCLTLLSDSENKSRSVSKIRFFLKL